MTRSGFHPQAIDKNIPPGSNDPAIIPAGPLLHIAVSRSDSLSAGFNDGRGIESHFYVRYDGKFEQYRSIWFEADAQADGNSFMINGKLYGFVSFETEGMPDEPLTKAQIDTLLMLWEWLYSKARFPRRVCPAWNRRGAGYHRLFKEWNPDAHSCPGDIRIKQFYNVLIPKLQAGAPMTHLGIFRQDVIKACDTALATVSKNRIFARGTISKIRALAVKLPNR